LGVLGVAGLLATLAVWQWALAPHRVWSADASVVFLAPVPKTDNPYTWFPKNAQYVAQTAALEVSSDAGRQRLASPRASFDARLVNVGSQWVPVYDRPTVSVHVLGTTPEDVEAVRRAVVDELVRIGDRQQATLGAPPQNRITTSTFGLDAPASPTGGRRSRAMAVLFLLTGALWLTFLRLARRSLARAHRDGQGAEVGHPQQLVGVGGAGEDFSG
jgi:hypothetical protein